MYIASVASVVKFHDFPNGDVEHTYEPGTADGINSISWSRDGNWVIIVPSSGPAQIISIKNNFRLLRKITEIDEPTCATFQHTTKKSVAIGTKSGSVFLYDVKLKNIKKRFQRTSSQVTHVEFTLKDTHCVAGCHNGEVYIYNNVTNSAPSILKMPKSKSLSCLKTSQLKRNLVMGGSREGMISVWDINLRKVKFSVEAHCAPVNSVAFSPINSDLIVTAGADRQFCCYDIISGQRVASNSVENTITATDFSPDGTYLVMASQNGHIYIYDSRNILIPVHSFISQSNSKHISFQPTIDAVDSSICSISNESVPQSSNPNKKETRVSRSTRNSDFLGMILPIDEQETEVKRRQSGECKDSFIVALGLNQTNTDNSTNSDSVFIAEKSRLQSIPDIDQENTELRPTKEHDNIPKQFASTPKYFMQRSELSPSPFPPKMMQPNEMKNLMMQCLEEYFSNVSDNLKKDMQYQTSHITYESRIGLLDLKMAMVKEFIKLEDFNNKIKDMLIVAPSVGNEMNLVEENVKLQMQIFDLKQELVKKNSSSDSSLAETVENLEGRLRSLENEMGNLSVQIKKK